MGWASEGGEAGWVRQAPALAQSEGPALAINPHECLNDKQQSADKRTVMHAGKKTRPNLTTAFFSHSGQVISMYEREIETLPSGGYSEHLSQIAAGKHLLDAHLLPPPNSPGEDH